MTQSLVSDYDSSKGTDQEAQTFKMICNNVEGDMIFITDLSIGIIGHGISEVKVWRSLIGEIVFANSSEF